MWLFRTFEEVNAQKIRMPWGPPSLVAAEPLILLWAPTGDLVSCNTSDRSLSSSNFGSGPFPSLARLILVSAGASTTRGAWRCRSCEPLGSATGGHRPPTSPPSSPSPLRVRTPTSPSPAPVTSELRSRRVGTPARGRRGRRRSSMDSPVLCHAPRYTEPPGAPRRMVGLGRPSVKPERRPRRRGSMRTCRCRCVRMPSSRG